MTKYDATGIGEGGIRLAVGAGGIIERAESFRVQIAGTEANVLCSLSNFGHKTAWFSALPDSKLGRRVEYQYRSYGVDLSHVKKVPDARLGTYYVEYATEPNPTRVSFDRANTAFTNMTVNDIDWDALLDTKIILLSGLSVPLSPSVCKILQEASKRAYKANVPVAFDVNYRSLLWTKQEAASILLPFIENAHILFCKRDDVDNLLKKTNTVEDALSLLKEHSAAKYIVMSDGANGAAALIDGVHVHEDAYNIRIVDRLGAGDGMAAGFIHAYLKGEVESSLKYAMAAAALALTHYGEQIPCSVFELDDLVKHPNLVLVR